MPRLNGTGPIDQGTGTGQGLGPCGGGMRRGWGCYGDFGRRKFISSKNKLATPEDEGKMLKEELATVRGEKIAPEKQQK